MLKHIALLFFLVLAGLYTAYWFVAADRIEQQFLAQIDPNGDRLEARAITTGGFPYRLWLRVEQPRYTMPGLHPRRIESGEWLIRSRPLRPGRIDLKAKGPHRLYYVEEVAGRPLPKVQLLTARAAKASLSLTARDLDYLDVALTGFRAWTFDVGSEPDSGLPDEAVTPATSIDRVTLTLSAISPFLSLAGQPRADDAIALSLRGLERDSDLLGLLSNRIERVDVQAELFHADPLTAFVAGLTRDRALTLSNWARQDGQITFRQLAIEWGDVGLSLTGHLGIDRTGNLTGDVITFFSGHDPLITRLEQHGLLDRAYAFDTRRKFGLAQRFFGNNEAGATKIPLRLSGGAAYLPIPTQSVMIFPTPALF